MRPRLPSGASLASMIAVIVASILFAASLWRALLVEPLPGVLPSAAPGSVVLAGDSRRAASSDTRRVVLASDPFSPDRGLPRVVANPVVAVRDTAPRAPAPVLRLLGTVVRAPGGFAICQLSGNAPRIVHVGDRLGELTLVSVEQGRALFRTPSGTPLDISLSKPGP